MRQFRLNENVATPFLHAQRQLRNLAHEVALVPDKFRIRDYIQANEAMCDMVIVGGTLNVGKVYEP